MAAPHFLSLTALPHGFDDLREESVKQGFTMLTRLASEWEAGTNRFDRPNELLLGAFRDNQLVATGGLNIDPYASASGTARIRHVYVLDAERKNGIGRALILRLLAHAAGRFHVVRLWTGRATALYDRLGFDRTDDPKATHILNMADRVKPNA